MNLRLDKVTLNFHQLCFVAVAAAVVFLRLSNLGYSDYLKDEHRTFYDTRYPGTFWDFALDQRKGPLQYLVAFIPKAVVGNFANELAQRLPFALANILAVYIFYLVSVNLTKDIRVALTAAALLAFNGFVTGFGRIAQYQNLNLLWSFLALFFYAKMAHAVSKNWLYACLGSLCLALSCLAHWDAVFVAVPAALLWVNFLTGKSVPIKTKLVSLSSSLIIGSLLVLPFLIPYLYNQSELAGNRSYLERRVAFNTARDLEFDFLIKLYNPFVSYYVYIVLGLVGLLCLKKSWVFGLWFLVDYLLFYFFAAKPGTHVYNFLIPVFVLCAIGFWRVVDFWFSRKTRWTKYFAYFLVFLLTLVLWFMFYQSYRLFVENRAEYPWEDEQILFLTAKKYTAKKVLPLFGFPHYRGWKEIGQFIQAENKKNSTAFTYDTNEDNSNISFYTGVDKSRSMHGYFFVGIKRPISFVQDWKPKQVKNKTSVKEIRTNNETVAVVYAVYPKVE